MNLPEVEVFTDAAAHVRGFLHHAATTASAGLVLTHGAGANARSPLLIAIAETFAAASFTVLRCDLPFRQTRPFGPPGAGDAARDRQGLKEAAVALRKLALGKLYLAGHSYGGRQASMLCAEEPDVADGLLLLSYPLHPPRKPEQPRTQHFPGLQTPALFVEGTRDPFGSTDEMEAALKLIPQKTELLKIDGEGHDLGFKGKSRSESLAPTVLKAFAAFFR